MCKYIDGVRFFSDKLFGLAEEMRLSPKCVQEARPEGYFARHINFKSSVFYRIAGTETPGEVRCEVQVATELATRIWEATHPIYEAEREHEQASEEWQWDPKDPRFISRQLGHMIHLADGLILRLREASHPSETERKRK